MKYTTFVAHRELILFQFFYVQINYFIATSSVFTADQCLQKQLTSSCGLSVPKNPISEAVLVIHQGMNLQQCEQTMERTRWREGIYCNSRNLVLD